LILKKNLALDRKSSKKKRKIIEIESDSDDEEDDDNVSEEMNNIEMILCDDGPQQQPVEGNLNKL